MATLYPGGPVLNSDGSFNVRSGDWLSHYSQGLYGDFDHIDVFYRSNAVPPEPIPNPNLIKEGERLYHIPREKYGDAQRRALELVNAFAARSGAPAFRHIDRHRVAQGLRQRVMNPALVQQGPAGLCGPASLVFLAARDNPVDYVLLVIDLFETGKGRLKALQVEPCADLLDYNPPLARDGGVHPADWMPMASIRNSANWFFEFADIGHHGGTAAFEVAAWLRQAGFTSVANQTSLFLPETEMNLRAADFLQRKEYKLILVINADVLKAPAKRSAIKLPNHYVVLTTPIWFRGYGVTSHLEFNVFTWGRERQMIPYGSLYMRTEDFLAHYYGFIAARF